MSNSQNESFPSTPEGQSQPFPNEGSLKGDEVQISLSAGNLQSLAPQDSREPSISVVSVMDSPTGPSAQDLQRRLEKIHAAQYYAYKRRQLRTCILLFVLTMLSTFLVGSGYIPLEYVLAKIFPRFERFLADHLGPAALDVAFREACRQGLEYSIPLMSILFFHEMGHYLQSWKNRVPASLPYFIPLPLPPMGTMGAVIFQGRGVATRRQMFDIAVCGPIAGLVLTIPVLWYGLSHSGYEPRPEIPSLEFGEPLLLKWMITAIHGAAPEGEVFTLNSIAFAGWVGVLVTAMNLLPVGQLDGGHILYTLIGRKAHLVAYLVIVAGIVAMMVRQNFSFSLLLILLMMTGPRHPPTANDAEPLGIGRHIIGWLTLSFLIIGFTPDPIVPTDSPADESSEERVPERRRPPKGDLVKGSQSLSGSGENLANVRNSFHEWQHPRCIDGRESGGGAMHIES